MDERIATPLLIGALAGGGALLWSATRRQRAGAPPSTSTRPMTSPSSTPLPAALPSHWLWPVPPWRDYRPEVSSPWGTPRRRLDGTKRTHLGVDIMYRRRSSADQRVTFPPSTANGSADFFMPDDVPALAVDVGTVTWSKAGARGHAVVLRHAGAWRTFYQHLERPRVKVGDQVLPGQVLGIVGGDPTQKPPLKHLHFEVWRGDGQEHAVNPEPVMTRQWRYAHAAPPTTTSGDLVAMTYYNDYDPYDLSNGRVTTTKPGTTGGGRPPPQRHHPVERRPRPRPEYQWVPGQDGQPGHWDASGRTRPAPQSPPQGYPPPMPPPGYPPMQGYPPPGYPPMQGYPPPMPPPGYPPMQGYPPPPMMPGPFDPYGQPYDPSYGGGVVYVDEYGNPVPPPQPPIFDPTAFGYGWPGW